MSEKILDMDWAESTDTLPMNKFICSPLEVEDIQEPDEVLSDE